MALVLAATLAVAGCSIVPTGTGSPERSAQAASEQAQATKAAPQETAKAAHPASNTDVLAEKVKASLTRLGSTAKLPNREQMLAAMLEAGAAKGKVEVSIDRTPTGLAVDAIEAAAPVDRDCVIGQVRDGKASVAVLPLLASGRCFVGDQH